MDPKVRDFIRLETKLQAEINNFDEVYFVFENMIRMPMEEEALNSSCENFARLLTMVSCEKVDRNDLAEVYKGICDFEKDFARKVRLVIAKGKGDDPAAESAKTAEEESVFEAADANAVGMGRFDSLSVIYGKLGSLLGTFISRISLCYEDVQNGLRAMGLTTEYRALDLTGLGDNNPVDLRWMMDYGIDYFRNRRVKYMRWGNGNYQMFDENGHLKELCMGRRGVFSKWIYRREYAGDLLAAVYENKLNDDGSETKSSYTAYAYNDENRLVCCSTYSYDPAKEDYWKYYEVDVEYNTDGSFNLITKNLNRNDPEQVDRKFKYVYDGYGRPLLNNSGCYTYDEDGKLQKIDFGQSNYLAVEEHGDEVHFIRRFTTRELEFLEKVYKTVEGRLEEITTYRRDLRYERPETSPVFTEVTTLEYYE